MSDIDTAREALRGLAAHRADNYDDWLRIGMALHAAGAGCQEWDAWSRASAKYKPGDCEKKWNGFGRGSAAVGIGTLVHMAREDGATIQGHREPRPEGHALTWESTIGPAVPVVDAGFVEEKEIPGPARPAVDDLRLYLHTLFHPDDVVAYTTEARKTEEGKWTPQGRGHYTRTAMDILDALETQPIDVALNATLHAEAGAWCRLNPFDGNGVADANVAEYRHALVESDGMPPERQLALMKELNLPAVLVVHSGGKSLHAVVRIDAGKDLALYRKRVNDLYDVLKQNGFVVDHQNRNPSRLSRLPGVDRGGRRQYIVAENIGAASWQAWEDWRNEYDDRLPPFEDMAALMANPPPLSPVLIDGVLRQGHKLLLSGPSKAGKSFALIQLCAAISEGGNWLGMPCAAGRVLYINMELDRASCVKRFADVCAQMATAARSVDVWNLRGNGCGLGELVPKLVRRMAGRSYAAVVIDPIYKLLTGDENSNSDMAIFCNHLDKISMLTGTAVVVASHFSKGLQGGKASIDRTAGAGVFGRDPDAILTLTEIEDEAKRDGDAYRVEFTLREFARHPPLDVFFRYPVHVSAGESMKSSKVAGAPGRKPKTSVDALLVALLACEFKGHEHPSLAVLMDEYNGTEGNPPVSDDTIRRWGAKLVPERDGWRYSDGQFWRVN